MEALPPTWRSVPGCEPGGERAADPLVHHPVGVGDGGPAKLFARAAAVEHRFLGARFPVGIAWDPASVGMTHSLLDRPFEEIGDEEEPDGAGGHAAPQAAEPLQPGDIVARR